MCGIAGVRRFGEMPILRDELAILLCSLEHRGNHATGMAIVNSQGTEIVCHKMPEPAWSFIKNTTTDQFLNDHLRDDTEIVLLHTRAATCGSPLDNKNNHPMWAGASGATAVVHNGSIRNYDTLFKSETLEPVCDTDSDYIRAVFDREGFEDKAVRLLNKASGSGAIAAVSTDYPGHLALGRSGNPLIYGSGNDKLYFASESSALHKAMRPFVLRHGLMMRVKPETSAYMVMPDDTMYFIAPDQTSTHHALKISTNFFAPAYRAHETYRERMKTWKVATKPDRVFTACRKCKQVQSKHVNTDWSNLRCSVKDCNEPFDYMNDTVSVN